MIKTIFAYVLSLFILLVALYLGKGIAKLLPIGIPESIWGLLLLLIAMVSGVIKQHWVSPTSRLLTRYMPLFFLPICVGIIEYADILAQHFASLVLANLFSSIFSLLLIGWLAQWLFTRRMIKGEKE